ncbi:MAG: hypothetical protein GXY29_12750 [Thermotogaceae bacterium]|nr:hypothetical protein [Thermotogaceae bacterium]
MEKLARVFFVLTLIFAAAFVVFFLFYFRTNNEQTALVIERANLKQQVATLSTELNRRGIYQQELERKIQLLEAEKPGPAATQTEEIDALKAQVSALRDEVEKKSAQIALLSTSQTGSSSEREKALQEDIIRLKQTYDDEYAKLQLSLRQKDDEIARLTKTLEAQGSPDEQVKTLQTQLGSLQKDLTKAQVDLDSTKRSVSERDIEITALKTQLEAYQKNNQTLVQKDQEIAGLKAQVVSLQAQTAQKETEIKNLNAGINTLTKEKESLYQQLTMERIYQPIPPGESDAVRYKYLILGEDALLAEKYKESAENFQKAQLKDLSLGVMATVYTRKRDLSYQKAISLYYSEGIDLYKGNRFEEAISPFIKASALAQEVKTDYDDDVLYYLGLSYYQMKNYAEAETQLKTVYALKESTYKVHALYYLVRVAMDAGKRTEALAYANQLKTHSQYATFARDAIKTLGE